MRNLREELEREVQAGNVPFWDPAVGGILVGKLLKYDVRAGFQGQDTVVATIEAEDPAKPDERVVDVWLSRSVLFAEFRKLRPAPGERVGIAYLGPQTSKEEVAFELYRVTVDREGAGAVPDFERIAES